MTSQEPKTDRLIHKDRLTPKYSIGTSGYSYNDWKGVFYPESMLQKDFFDYYALFFSALELNYTFYRMPTTVSLTRYSGLGRLCPVLSVKAYKSYTHEHQNTRPLIEMLSSLQPLIDNDRLKTILFQFPWSFRPGQYAWDKLHDISEAVQYCTPVVEFRHVSWFADDILQKLKQMNLSVCALDMPNNDDLPGTQFPITHQVGYMRFHGRNISQWWNSDAGWKRHNYLYTYTDLKQLLPQVRSWIQSHQQSFLFFNNHYRAQAVNNAQLLMAFLAS